MQWLANISVRRPVFATVLILSLVVVGIFSYFKLGVDRFPKVDFPNVVITLREDGASPEEIETEVVDKVEEAVNTISSIDQLSSTSYEGVGQIIVTFQLEKDINVAVQEVRDKVSGVIPNLPTDLKPPVVDKVDPDASPILDIALSSKGSIRDTTEFADKVLRRQIESISGVGQVTVVGGRARQINLFLDPDRMKSLSITTADVQRSLVSQNIQVPGGDVDQNTRKLTLRTHGRVQSPAEFGEIIITKRGGASVRIKDVARVEDSVEETKTVASLNGVPTCLLSVRKQSGLNTVATVDAVLDKLKIIQKSLPSGYNIKVVRDGSTYIKASTHAVQEHLVVGSILAALVVLIFLWNWRTTAISALAIPASIISTFALMYAMGFTLNGLTLLALTLSVGIVIDDAIVVLENIYHFIEDKGYNPFEAAIEATREIGLAVMATTLSLIAVFLPVAFMTGIVGRFMNSFGLTMAFAIFVSLIVSFTLTPMLASRWIKKPNPKGGEPAAPEGMQPGMPGTEETGTISSEHRDAKHPHRKSSNSSSSKETGIFRPIDIVYTWLLKWSMRHRWVIVLACLASLVAVPMLGKKVPFNFLPEDDESQFQVSIRTPEGTSLIATQDAGEKLAKEIRDSLPGVDYTILTIGNNAQKTENLVSIFVKLKNVDQRPTHPQRELTQLARTQILPKYKNLHASAGPVPAFSTGAPPAVVTYYIAGPDLDKLTEYSQTALAQLKKVPGVVDADSSLVTGKPELGVNIDREKAAELGVSVSDISNALRLFVGGAKVTDYYEHGEQYEVHLRADLPFRVDSDVISQMTVPSTTAPAGNVLLRDVVQFSNGSGPAQISRLNRRRNVLLTCNVSPGFSQQKVADELAKIVQNLHMPPTYDTGVTGTSKELVKAGVAFITSFILAIIFMYLILAAQFESWIHPITILLALPLTIPYALLAMIIFHEALNIFTVLGILVLFGVVKKNGILQVDHTNQLRARGMDRYDAIIQANRDRLRPILMTTIAFVAGMVPLVISKGVGAATNRGIGFTVIGGQTLSLLLTLLATPVFYSLFDDMQGWPGKITTMITRRSTR